MSFSESEGGRGEKKKLRKSRRKIVVGDDEGTRDRIRSRSRSRSGIRESQEWEKVSHKRKGLIGGSRDHSEEKGSRSASIVGRRETVLVVADDGAGTSKEAIGKSKGAAGEGKRADKGKNGGEGEGSYLSRMAKVGANLRSLLLSDGSAVTKRVAKEIMDSVAILEAIIGEQSQEVAFLKGRLEERGRNVSMRASTQSTSMPPPTQIPVHVPASADFPALGQGLGSISKGETYAVVARSITANPEKGAVKAKVLAAGTQMGAIKVKGVRELKDGGVAIIAKSAREIRKIKEAPAFKEAGLQLSEPRMSEPKLLVLEVPGDVTNDILVGEIMKNNLQGIISEEDLCKVRVVNRLPRKGGKCAIVVEAPSKARRYLLAEGRIYVGFTSYRIREYEDVPRCYGCGGFGHMLTRCSSGRLCHNCGTAGHKVEDCKAAAKCRNCAVRGLPSSHRVTSSTCPCFLREVERRRGLVIG